MSKLFDAKAACKWEEAYPLGNGRIGAMIFGQPGNERIQLNEDSVWYGSPEDRVNPDAKEHLAGIRGLIRDGRIPEAERAMKLYLSGVPQSQRPFQSAGDLFLDWEDTVSAKDGYERELDLERAVACSISRSDAGETKKEYLISAPDQVLAIHAKAAPHQKISCTGLLVRGKYYETVERVGNDTILLKASCGEDGVNLAVAAKAVAEGGSVEVAGEHLVVTDAKELTIYLAVETTFYLGEEGLLPDEAYGTGGVSCTDGIKEALRKEKEAGNHIRRALRRVNQAAEKGYAKIKEAHIADYRRMFGRVKLTLSGDREVQEKLDYTQRYFDYGRYLLISSSRPGTLPANLQGIWNKEMEPAWESKFTININTQMNYWPAEVCDLPECHLPLFDLLKRMVGRGREVAEQMYGCRGFVAHHNTDLWADCAPQDICISSAYWVMGAAWLCTHIKMHFEYTRDLDFLREMYPVLSEAALFFQDFLIEEQGNLVTSPSISPENTYIMKDGTRGCACAGSSMDTQILRDLLSFYRDASEVLQVENEFTRKNLEILDRLPETQIGKHGQIMEWREDYDEAEPGHRHISQLYALHPSDQITCDGTPELAQAAGKTLERRLHFGGGHTGWSCAWIVNLYARLRDGNAAWENLQKLFEKSTFPNMMDNHPMMDGYIFQIDGNFGATTGIAEMLLQSNRDRSILLPALPDDWKNGSIEGLVLNGGAKADLAWKDGRLESCRITARKGFAGKIVYGGASCEVTLPENGVCVIRPGEGEELLEGEETEPDSLRGNPHRRLFHGSSGGNRGGRDFPYGKEDSADRRAGKYLQKENRAQRSWFR